MGVRPTLLYCAAMKAHSPRGGWPALLLALATLTVGCVARMPRSVSGMPDPRARLLLSRPSSVVVNTNPARPRHEARQDLLAAQWAFRGAVGDVSLLTRRISHEISRFRSNGSALSTDAGSPFVPFVDDAERQLRWIEAQLAAATQWANAASTVERPVMQLALLRLAGPPLERAQIGAMLLAVWIDFLRLADHALPQRLYSAEQLFVDLSRVQDMLAPGLRALASERWEDVRAAEADAPALVGHLTHEFATIQKAMRVGAETLHKALAFQASVEALSLLSGMKFSLPAVPPSAPAVVGLGLMVGGEGVMMGTRVVVSAQWVEMMRQLVRAGVLSVSVVGSAVWIQAGQTLMAQSHGDLPKGVRDALGEGPEVRSMRVTGRAGAGMNDPPRHHVLPKEFREWFEKRGFTGEMDIDQFCIEMEQAHHEAIHGGGDWKRGRAWAGEWNRRLMDTLRRAETRAGRTLSRHEILDIAAEALEDYQLPMNFVPWRGR